MLYHHRQLIGPFLPDRGFGTTGLRTMRQAIGMQSHRAVFDTFSAHELRVCVIEDFVGHNVRVRIGGGHCFGIEIVRTRAERADNKPVAFERLVRGRRQMKTPDARLEIVNVDGPRKIMAIPADYIKGMIGQESFRSGNLPFSQSGGNLPFRRGFPSLEGQRMSRSE